MGVIIAFFSFSVPIRDSNTARQDQIRNLDKGENDTKKDADSGTYFVGSDLVAHVSSIQVQPTLQWIRDIEFVENPINHLHELIEIKTTRFFQTLFQQIISPNAP